MAQARGLQLLDGLAEHAVALRQRLGEVGMVQRGAVFPQRSGDRGAHRAGGDAGEVAQARRGGDALGPDARQGDGGQRNEEEGHGRALDQGGNQDVQQIRLRRELRAQPQHQREHHERAGGHAPRVPHRHLAAHQGCEHDGEHPHR